MAFEWLLITHRTKQFRRTETTVEITIEPGVGEDGEPKEIEVRHETSSEILVDALADRVRVRAASNAVKVEQFHIRLIYGRLDANGEFERAERDDGIVIGGQNYRDLDTNDDGLISEDELLTMSAKLLGWDGELKELATTHVEGERA